MLGMWKTESAILIADSKIRSLFSSLILTRAYVPILKYHNDDDDFYFGN